MFAKSLWCMAPREFRTEIIVGAVAIDDRRELLSSVLRTPGGVGERECLGRIREIPQASARCSSIPVDEDPPLPQDEVPGAEVVVADQLLRVSQRPRWHEN